MSGNWELLNFIFKEAKRRANNTSDDRNILCMLNDVGHMAFSDLSLILLLELRIIQFTPSFSQLFRCQYNLKLILDVTRAFLLGNRLSHEGGNYDDLLGRLEKTNDVIFELK